MSKLQFTSRSLPEVVKIAQAVHAVHRKLFTNNRQRYRITDNIRVHYLHSGITAIFYMGDRTTLGCLEFYTDIREQFEKTYTEQNDLMLFCEFENYLLSTLR